MRRNVETGIYGLPLRWPSDFTMVMSIPLSIFLYVFNGVDQFLAGKKGYEGAIRAMGDHPGFDRSDQLFKCLEFPNW